MFLILLLGQCPAHPMTGQGRIPSDQPAKTHFVVGLSPSRSFVVLRDGTQIDVLPSSYDGILIFDSEPGGQFLIQPE